MSYALLWIEMLAASLLWIAMSAAIVGRRRALGFVTLMIFICFIPLLILLCLSVATGYLKFAMLFEINWFYYFCSLFIAFLIGMLVILNRAARSADTTLPRAAAAWPRAKLSLAFLTALAIGGMAMWNMDLAARAVAEAGRTEAGAIMLSVVPPVVSDDRNAAFLYLRAHERLVAKDSLKPPASTVAWKDTTADEPGTAEYLQSQGGTLRILRQAGAMPECRFDHDYARPSITTRLPELNGCRECVLLLQLDARHQLVKGNVSGAIDDANAMLQLARHIGREPILVSLLVAVSFDKMGIDTLSEALPAVTDKKQIASVNVGDVDEPQRMLQHAFMGEEAFGLSVFSDIASSRLTFSALAGPANDPSHWIAVDASWLADHGPAPMLFRVFFLQDELESYRECLRHYQLPRAKDFFPTSANISADDRKEIEISHTGILHRMLIPALSRVQAQCARSQAYRANAIVAVAMTRYRLDHGAYPEKLDQLVPGYLDEIPTDPFDGKPIRMTHAGDQWTIYSIGPDGKDDGGKAFNNTDKTGDLTLVLLAAGAKPTTKPAGE